MLFQGAYSRRRNKLQTKHGTPLDGLQWKNALKMSKMTMENEAAEPRQLVEDGKPKTIWSWRGPIKRSSLDSAEAEANWSPLLPDLSLEREMAEHLRASI